MTEITKTQEDYVRALYLRSEEQGDGVKLTDLVQDLGLNKSTVTQRMDDLVKKGWVSKERYGPVSLTQEGWKIAENLTYKHRIIETFLCDVLKMEEKDVHEEAHRLEHAVSDTVILAMAKHLDFPDVCPHGRQLPTFHEDMS